MKSERRLVSTASVGAVTLFTILLGGCNSSYGSGSGTAAATAGTANSGRVTALIARSRTRSSGTKTGAGTGATGSAGSASLSWQAPSANSDGSPLINLAGFHIRYGTQPANLNEFIDIASASTLQYAVTNLASGTWYFNITSYTTDGAESSPSATVTASI
jgi:hypothetical protein